MSTTKIVKEMDKMTIKTVKGKSLTSILRGMKIGDIVKVNNNVFSVKTIICRLNKEGLKFTTSVKGLKNGVFVERIK